MNNKPWYTAWWGWASIILLTAAACVVQVAPIPQPILTPTPTITVAPAPTRTARPVEVLPTWPPTLTFTPIPRATSTTMPPTPTIPPTIEPYHRYYVVQPDDTLWGISLEYYGTGMGWWLIHDANRKIIADPHWIYAGQEIIVP